LSLLKTGSESFVDRNMKVSEYKHIVIIRLSALGDIVHTLPAFALLREAFPYAKISWVVEARGAKLLENVTGIDNLIVLDLKQKGFLNKIKEINGLRSLYGKREPFDLILDFQGLLKSAVLTWLLKGKLSVGFHQKNLKEPLSRIFYKQAAAFFDETDREDSTNHVVFKNIHMVLPFCNAAARGTKRKTFSKLDWKDINVPLEDPGRRRKSVTAFLASNRLEVKNFLILNIGGGWDSKLLPIDQYIEIIERIRDKYRVVVLWGNEGEKKTAEEISRRTGAVMSAFFNFGELILLIMYSRLVVTGDTLALHLADLVKTPSIGIFGPTSPFRNGSLMEASVSIFEKLPCGFCYKKKCGTIECITKINTRKIVETIETLYEKQLQNI
jgi:heptosyltransferase-1